MSLWNFLMEFWEKLKDREEPKSVPLSVLIICSLKKPCKLGKLFHRQPVDQWLVDYHSHEIIHEV